MADQDLRSLAWLLAVRTLDPRLTGRDAATKAAVAARVVDTLGCMAGAVLAEAGGFPDRLVAAAGRFALGAAGTGRPNAIGIAAPVPLEYATFVNCVAARYLDLNDIFLASDAVHPSDNIPLALTLGTALGADGADIGLAVLRGYEVHCALAQVARTRQLGWDNVVLGALAATAMSGSLLRLPADRLVEGFRLAASGNVALSETRAGGISMWKAGASAYAARAGLFAALLAEQGVSGPPGALDGDRGLAAKVLGLSQPYELPVADRPLVHETGIKRYPIQYFVQGPVELAARLRDQVDVDRIDSVVVTTYEYAKVAAADSPAKWSPANRETADHSMPFGVAVGLVDGTVTGESYARTKLSRSAVAELMRRVRVEVDDAATARYPAALPVRLDVTLADGSTVSDAVEYPEGHARRPMSAADLTAKFVNTAAGNAAATQDTAAELLDLFELSADRVRKVVDHLILGSIR